MSKLDNTNSECKCGVCNHTIGCVIIGMNEERHVSNTLESILAQTLRPKQVVFINDNSTDRTFEIASSFDGVTVLNYPEKHENWVIRKELAKVFNFGLLQLSHDLDFVTVVGSDEVLPPNHFEYITDKMIRNNLMIASGMIKGEYSTIPRGSGRIVNWRWWLGVSDGMYPVNYGYESWLIAKCRSTGNRFEVFSQIESYVQRPTGTNYRSKLYEHRGQAYRALGYNRRFVILRMILMSLKYRSPLSAVRMLMGFMDRSVIPYSADVRDYYRDLQDRQVSIFNMRDLASRYREL